MTAQTVAFTTPSHRASREAPSVTEASHDCPHVLLVVSDQRTRYTLADMLLNAGCRLTICSSHGAPDLLQGPSPFDLMVAAQPVENWSGVARLARSASAALPIVMLEDDTASGPGVLAAVQSAIERWPAVV